MTLTYTAVAGDTFDSISQRFYNTAKHADLLAIVNGVSGDLQPGQMLSIPANP